MRYQSKSNMISCWLMDMVVVKRTRGVPCFLFLIDDRLSVSIRY